MPDRDDSRREWNPPLTATAFQQFHRIVATVINTDDLVICASLDFQIGQIALSIQKSYAKNAKSCVYYYRETGRGSIRDTISRVF
jgi:hypothetical protein